MVESPRALKVADSLHEVHSRVMALADGATDADWAVVCLGEQWSVLVVLDDIAKGYSTF